MATKAVRVNNMTTSIYNVIYLLIYNVNYIVCFIYIIYILTHILGKLLSLKPFDYMIIFMHKLFLEATYSVYV